MERYFPQKRLRITYSQEMKVKEYLDKEHIESFIPMRYVEKD